MKKHIRARIAAGAAALLSAFAVLAPGLAQANTAYGVAYNSQTAFKVSSYNAQGSANFAGTPTTGQLAPQVRLLKNGTQVGSVTTYGELTPGVYYNFNGYATYACSGLGLSTFVVQSRLVKRASSGPLPTTWDSGPGKNIYCN